MKKDKKVKTKEMTGIEPERMKPIGEVIKKGKKIGDFKRPTVAMKHKVVLKKLSENGGNMSKAIRDSGLYSDTYAKTPSKLFKSESWNELMDEAFPDKEVAKIHQGLLTQKKVRAVSFDANIDDKDAKDLCIQAGFVPTSVAFFLGKKWVYCLVPDTDAREKALDKVYKIKGRYKETFAIESDRFRKMSDAELAEIITRGQKFFSKQ